MLINILISPQRKEVDLEPLKREIDEIVITARINNKCLNSNRIKDNHSSYEGMVNLRITGIPAYPISGKTHAEKTIGDLTSKPAGKLKRRDSGFTSKMLP